MSEGADFAAFAQAVEHHRAGRLEAAESLYRKVLPTDSRHADALHLSGVAALQLGRFDEAARKFDHGDKIVCFRFRDLQILLGDAIEDVNHNEITDWLVRIESRGREPW